MFRDRTNLYVSFRQSYTHHPQYTTSSGFDRVPEEERGLIGADDSNNNGFDNDSIAVEMDLLPPRWVDISDEVDEQLRSIRGKITQLDSLHKKNALPGFDDRTKEEQQIESLTYEITANLHQLQNQMKKFDQMTSEQSHDNTNTPAHMKMAANMKISLATKIQETSTIFRKMQSGYLKSLRNNSDSGGAGAGSRAVSPSPYSSGYDPAIMEDDLDVSFSEHTLQQTSSKLATVQDANVRQREQEINKIAQGIIELADIFKDLQTMIIDQGTLLDRIDYNVETMYTQVKQADKELVQATHYQKRTQKCKIILLLSLLVVALIIILIIKPKRHDSSSPPSHEAPERPTRPDTPS